MFKEECWILYGFSFKSFFIGFLVYDCEGSKTHINFVWQKSFSRFLIGWFHTHHINCTLDPSSTDQKTMRSWVRALAKPLLCGIMHDINIAKSKCYLFERQQDSSIKYKSIKHKIYYKKIFIGF